MNELQAEVKPGKSGLLTWGPLAHCRKQWLQFDAPAHELEELLLTKYHIFENLATGVQNIACSQSVCFFCPSWAHRLTRTRYHVPHNVSHHIDYITPGIKLMSGGHEEKVLKRKVGRRHLTGDLRGKARKGDKWKGKGRGKCKPPKPVDPGQVDPGQDDSIFKVTGPCSDEITPQCIRSKSSSYRTGPLLTICGEFEANPMSAQYQIPNGTKAIKGNELGIFQSLNEHYSQEDLDTYWRNIAPYAFS